MKHGANDAMKALCGWDDRQVRAAEREADRWVAAVCFAIVFVLCLMGIFP